MVALFLTAVYFLLLLSVYRLLLFDNEALMSVVVATRLRARHFRLLDDFELFKRNLNQIPFGAFILADKGYQGIYVLYPNSLLPLKAKRHCKLDPELKIYNQEINKRRIGIEHVFGSLKTFKILAERYRNRGKRLGLRFNLIAGIYNLELSKK